MTYLWDTLKLLHTGFNKSKIPNLDPEFFHNIAMKTSAVLENKPYILEKIRETNYVPWEENLKVSIWDLKFPNPVWLAAGFIKELVWLKFWKAFWFGSITLWWIT